MRLLVHFYRLVGPTFPVLTLISVLLWAAIFSTGLKLIFEKNSKPLTEGKIFKWIAGIAPSIGIVGTLLGLSGAYHNVVFGDPNSLASFLGQIGEAIYSSTYGLLLALIAGTSTFLLAFSNRGRKNG